MQIQNFSLAILHNNFEYSAYGLFTINYVALIQVSECHCSLADNI